MPPSSWTLPAVDPARAEALGRQLGVRALTAQLLLNRGVPDRERGERFLAPRLAHLRSPDGGAGGAGLAMAGFARAAERLAAALAAGETVGVFGDYDVDGLTSCALLTTFLRDAGGRVVPRVARRDAGYGFGVHDADAFAAAGCAVIVTCDCGTSDVDAIARATAAGAQVIVVDHHQVPERDPGAFALLNPHQRGCGFPFKGLASVGVAFYLACAVRTRLRARQADAPDPRLLLDLVAVGTVADMAPLTDENRVLVAAGLRELSRGARPGLRALGESAGLDFTRPMRSVDIGWRFGPRLNAPGRLGDAQLALDLLLATDAIGAIDRARQIEEQNLLRRALQDQVASEAIAQAEALPEERRQGALVVAGDGWTPGVVGIVAAKLVERYRLPVAVIALEGELGRGSLRTIPGVDLFRALQRCAPLLVRHGGHAAAAGLTIERVRLLEFAGAFAEAVRAGGAPAGHRTAVDAEVELDSVDERLADELERLGPFGVGNPEPLLAARVTVERTRVVAERHLQVTLRGRSGSHDGIAFNLAASDPGAGARVSALFVPEIDTYRGQRRLRLRVQQLDALSVGGPR